MEKSYFPMFVDISDMQILVAGGGRIALRRVRTLLKFTEQIRVVAPLVCKEIEELVQMGAVIWSEARYDRKYLKGMDVVLAATDIHAVNQKIVEDCREIEKESGKRILVNTADDKTRCDFYFPSVIKEEEIVIGINSGGKNPGRVKQVRKKMEDLLRSGICCASRSVREE